MALIFSDVTPEQLSAKRDNLFQGFDARIAYERDVLQDDVTAATVAKHKRNAEKTLDNATLAYAVANGIDFPSVFLDKRVEGAVVNEKALPKILVCLRVLNGGEFRVFQKGEESDNRTTAATILALDYARKNPNDTKFSYANFVNDTMGRWKRASYGAGGTQSGSSARALHALGIVNRYSVVNNDAFEVMLKAARKADKLLSK
jgi:hypothetical protein